MCLTDQQQAVGIYGFWFIQQRFKLGTKTMFSTIAVAIILLDGWGMIGIWTQKFGFHNGWEFWVRQTLPLCLAVFSGTNWGEK